MEFSYLEDIIAVDDTGLAREVAGGVSVRSLCGLMRGNTNSVAPIVMLFW